MEESSGQEKIYIFDSLYTNEHIQMLKIIYSNLSPQAKKSFAPVIKYLEFKYTLTLTKSGFPTGANEKGNDDTVSMIQHIYEDIKPLLSDTEKKQFSKIDEIYNMFQTFQQIQKTMEQFESMTGIKFEDMMGHDFKQDDLLNMLMKGDNINLMQSIFNAAGGINK